MLYLYFQCQLAMQILYFITSLGRTGPIVKTGGSIVNFGGLIVTGGPIVIGGPMVKVPPLQSLRGQLKFVTVLQLCVLCKV